MSTESALQRFLDTAATGLVRNTSDLRYAAANAAYGQLVGRPVDQIVGRTLEEVIGAEGFTLILPHVRRVLQGERVEFEAQVTFAATGPRWIHVIYTPDVDDNRTITGWVGSITDITDRKQMEQALQEREHVQRLLVQAGDIGARASSSSALIGTIAELVATELNVSRCGFALVDEESRTIIVVNDFHGDLPSLAGAYALTQYAGHLAEDSRMGRTVAVDDIAVDSRTAARYHEAFAPIQVRAHLTVPLLRNGRWVASFWASHHEPRHWTPKEIEVATLIGQRVWSGVERMRAEEALRRSQEHLRFVTDHAPVLLVHCDADERFTFANEPYAKRFDLGPDDVVGRRIIDVVGTAAYESIGAFVAAALRGEHVEFEQAVPYAYGTRWMHGTYVPHRAPDGTITGFVGALQDVTQRHGAEESLRRTEEMFRGTFENAAVGIAHVAPDGRWLRVNDRLCDVLGYGREALLDRTFQDVTYPDDLDADLEFVRQVQSGERQSYSMDKRYIRGDGSIVWARLTVALARTPDGRPDYFISVVEDITARIAAEHALREADKRKDEFLALLAHELRNPLAPIRTSMALMRSRPTADSLLLRCRDVVDRQVTQMARLLDDLLDISRLSRGKLTLQAAPVPLGVVLDAALEANLPTITQRNQQVAIEGVEERLVLEGDQARLTQVFGNLLNNAAKYSPSGARIGITVRREGTMVAIRVTDPGIGIPEEMLGSIFELFTQAEDARAHAPGGLGIGLSLAQRLVHMHGGTIEASSAGPGLGADFTVRLPLVERRQTDATTGNETGATVTAGCRVLVVDDNMDVADTHAMLLAEAGCQVETAYSGQEAMDAAERWRPDLLLLDIGLPDISGHDVCARLRATDWGAAIMIAAVTGWGQDHDRRRSAEAGFDRHLVKPVDPQVLVDLARELARK